ncbi:MAG: MBL fold metallo-hydrolase [Bacteroidota bacterium]
MFIFLSLLAFLCLGTFLFLQTERFGAHPKGERLARVKASPNYRDGAFQNLSDTPMLTEGSGYGQVLYNFLVSPKPKEPSQPLPTQRTDLLALAPNEDVLVWMGHSSYYFQLDGLRVLVDPVLCGYASPFSFSTKAYLGSDVYGPEDLPEIDYLIMTHDHWDHMDYQTLKALRPKVKRVITGLGTGAHLERWGYDPRIILEGDWYDSFALPDGLEVHVTPARHFSGRGFKRAQTLWASFVFQTPNKNIYLGGDSGYGDHFATIGERFGPFDLAILENGQYDQHWVYLHMMPGEHLQAARDLRAKALLPVHSGKFTLANHDWDEPLAEVTARAKGEDISVLTPRIGEKVVLEQTEQVFERWWEGAE